MLKARASAALLVCLLWAGGLSAQAQEGRITGRVVDASTLQPIPNASIVVDGTYLGMLTNANGAFLLQQIPVGPQRVTASLIGYAPQTLEVTVSAEETAVLDFSLQAQAVALEEVVVTGYGTQRRLAITGAVATVQADEANVGVVTDANDLMEGRVAGLTVVSNNGEPGAGVQVRVRGGTSISASNEPLYVIDGVPIQNVATEADGFGIGGSPSLPRSPLNMINPSDIESITVLKDASASAIYGSRAANGVVLIQTKRGQAGGTSSLEYNGYVSVSSPANYLNVLNGSQYRDFVQQQIAAGNLSSDRLENLGSANTDWERELTRSAVTHNHNLTITGGTSSTRYRASLNYMNQEGVVRSSGIERIQGRLNGTHSTWDERLNLDVNLTASHVANDYVAFQNEGGFEGAALQNMVVYNPTFPVRVADPATGEEKFFEIGAGAQSVRNPVGIASQVEDFANTTRVLGNLTSSVELFPGLTGQLTLGMDRSESTRRIYLPSASPVGAQFSGLAQQKSLENTAVTLQSLLTWRESFAEVHNVEIVGGYEYNDYQIERFEAEGRNFLTDAFSYNSLGAAATLVPPSSFEEDSRLVSFFGRANYNWNDRYFLTGVLRYDGSSRFGAGNKWALFPAVSGSWRISEEAFWNQPLGLSELRLRAGWGLQGNEAVPAYASLITLEPTATYGFGETRVTGVVPTRNPNPDLKWEETSQINVALDFGFLDNLLSGTVEFYQKNTTDLLLEVAVAQPALVATRLENIGEVKNTGVELSLDALIVNRPNLNWHAGLVFAAERNEVVDLGGRNFITTGGVSGQGQSGQVSQRILPGEPLGTFFGPEYVGVDSEGKQLFNQYRVERDASGKVTSRELIGQTTSPSGDDFVVLGDANPDFSVGLRSGLSWGQFDASMLVRWEQGRDVFNNTALVYSTKGNALQDKNFLQSALDDPIGILEPAIYSSRWIEDGSYVRLQNLTVGYTFELPTSTLQGRTARAYVSGDNLLLLTGYDGYDPEAHTDNGLASRGIDYLTYPRPRTFSVGVRVGF